MINDAEKADTIATVCEVSVDIPSEESSDGRVAGGRTFKHSDVWFTQHLSLPLGQSLQANLV